MQDYKSKISFLGRLAIMKGYREMTKEELLKVREELNERYEKCKALNLTLDMTRGKPSPVQLDLSNDIYDTLKDGFKTAKNEDTRNYGIAPGIEEIRAVFAELLGTDKDNIVLSLCFFNGRLTIAMNIDPSVEQMYVDRWDVYKTGHSANNVPPYCTTRAAKWYDDGSNASNAFRQCYNVNLPYVIANGIIKLDVVYWNGDYSNAYMFYNSNGVTNGVDMEIFICRYINLPCNASHYSCLVI